jgi:hypothetical protein
MLVLQLQQKLDHHLEEQDAACRVYYHHQHHRASPKHKFKN